MAEDARGPHLVFLGKRREVLDVRGFVLRMERAEGSVAVVRKGPGVHFPMVLGPLRHTQRHHERTLNFDLDVGQRVEEGRLRHELLVNGVLKANGSTVGPTHGQVRLHG